MELFSKKVFQSCSLDEMARDMSYVTAVSRAEQKDIEKAFARLFATEDGRKVLAWLQHITFHRAASYDSSDAQLRSIEGQRSLMAMILRLIDRGRAG